MPLPWRDSDLFKHNVPMLHYVTMKTIWTSRAVGVGTYLLWNNTKQYRVIYNDRELTPAYKYSLISF